MPVFASHVTIPRHSALGGGEWQLENLTTLTVIFGKNGSGKSVMLRAWRDKSPNTSHYVIPERTGEMEFNPNFLQEEFDPDRRRASSTRNFVNDYRRRIVSRIQTYFFARGNVREGKIPPGDPAEIERRISTLVPDFSLSLLTKIPPYELKRVETDEIISHIDQLSSGEAQMITLGLDILTIASLWEIEEANERILLVDEPDAHLHPDLVVRFADFLVETGRHFNLQIVVATHSTGLLAALGQFGGKDTSVIYLARKQDSYTARPFDAVTKETAACLGGHVLMGPLFGAPILLVEGDDDYRIWSQVPRHHITNFAVIPANGDEIRKYQKTLEEIFSSLREPSEYPLGYALLDGDKALPKPNSKRPQKFLRFIKLNCHEAENLYLTNEVLNSMGTTWQEAQAKITAESDKYGNKAQLLAAALEWDRKNGDFKLVINEVAAILDPKNVLWTVRVGAKLGQARPSGQLAEFLGEDVINGLWGNAID